MHPAKVLASSAAVPHRCGLFPSCRSSSGSLAGPRLRSDTASLRLGFERFVPAPPVPCFSQGPPQLRSRSLRCAVRPSRPGLPRAAPRRALRTGRFAGHPAPVRCGPGRLATIRPLLRPGPPVALTTAVPGFTSARFDRSTRSVDPGRSRDRPVRGWASAPTSSLQGCPPSASSPRPPGSWHSVHAPAGSRVLLHRRAPVPSRRCHRHEISSFLGFFSPSRFSLLSAGTPGLPGGRIPLPVGVWAARSPLRELATDGRGRLSGVEGFASVAGR